MAPQETTSQANGLKRKRKDEEDRSRNEKRNKEMMDDSNSEIKPVRNTVNNFKSSENKLKTVANNALRQSLMAQAMLRKTVTPQSDTINLREEGAQDEFKTHHAANDMRRNTRNAYKK